MRISDWSSDVCSSDLAGNDPVNLVSKHVPSPVGPLLLGADEEFLRLVWFSTPRHPLPRSVTLARGDNAVLRETGLQLEAYFAGPLPAFDLPPRPVVPAFQREYWSTLAENASGRHVGSAHLATRHGQPPPG